AVMSNHVHVVLRVDPENAAGWSDDEVAARWVRLFPARVDGEIDAQACRRKSWMLSGNAERMALLRERLSDLSWFMRCLSDRAQRRRRRRSSRCREAAEPMARLANSGDRCTG